MGTHIQYYTNFAEAKDGLYTSPEVLYLSDGIDSKLLFEDTEDGEILYLRGEDIPSAYFSNVLCLAIGTMILLPDGTEKPIEDITENDIIYSFNHETGALESSRVCIAFAGEDYAQPTTLHFSNGKSLSIVGRHGLLEESTSKYLAIGRYNVEQFIGKKFYSAIDGEWVELIGYENGDEKVQYFSVYSMNINCISNGMLSAPDDELFELNVYELDENLKTNAEQLATDIAQYGLLDVETECTEHPEKWDVIYALEKYLYIAIGKGLMTLEGAKKLYEFWG